MPHNSKLDRVHQCCRRLNELIRISLKSPIPNVAAVAASCVPMTVPELPPPSSIRSSVPLSSPPSSSSSKTPTFQEDDDEKRFVDEQAERGAGILASGTGVEINENVHPNFFPRLSLPFFFVYLLS